MVWFVWLGIYLDSRIIGRRSLRVAVLTDSGSCLWPCGADPLIAWTCRGSRPPLEYPLIPACPRHADSKELQGAKELAENAEDALYRCCLQTKHFQEDLGCWQKWKAEFLKQGRP